MMLTVYIDFKSPASYLALNPTLAMAERLGIPILWRPFRTFERDVPRQGTDESVAQSHRRVRAESRRAIHIKYAKIQGIDLHFPPTACETDLALAVLGELDGDPVDYIRACFSAYWDHHLSLNDEGVVQDIIKSTRATFAGDLSAARAAFENRQDQAESEGIVEAPAYVIDGQIFIGREHLPWIEEIAKSIP